MNRYFCFIGVVIFISCSHFSGVGQDTTKFISFRVVNENTGSPVEMAHVINLTKKEVAISDLLGYFKIPFAFGDSMSITSLGYFRKEILNFGQFKDDSTFYTIKLKSRSYEIKEIHVKWFASYESFLKGFSELKLVATKEERDLERVREYFSKIIVSLDLKNLPKATGGAGFGIDWLSKQNKNLQERLEKERKQRLIARKFSAGIVEALTGLTGNEVFWFMEYCGFTDEYILSSNDYSIRLRILDKFKIYNQDKAIKESM